VLDVARNAAQCGFQYFVIDAGWNTIEGLPTLTGNKDIDWILNLGDWKEDGEKFPGGLKLVFDSVAALGMKPGLWFSVATSTKNAKVFHDHPEWFIQDEKGQAAFLHDESGNPNQVTACLGTGYYDYIRKTILRFAGMGVRYVKLDLSIVTSAYRYDPQYTGCSARNHPFHRDREESYLAIYERCFQLFDDLHREVPDLYIDCTFETMGKLQLIDFAMLQHAEGNWLINIDEPAPKGSWRVRQMAWWRSPIIPASSMIIGNMLLDDPNYCQSLISLSGSMPVLLGDTRRLTDAEKSKIQDWADWMHTMQQRHQIMLYRQDLPGFGEPAEGNWDGFQRINTESSSGGIIGVFRQGAAESERKVTVRYLDPETVYTILSVPEGEQVANMNGKELAEEGFKVKLQNKWEGELFEVRIRELTY
jgi:alpha-galactosidase